MQTRQLIPDDKRASTRRRLAIGCILGTLALLGLAVVVAFIILNLSGSMSTNRNTSIPQPTPASLPDFPWPPRASAYTKLPPEYVLNPQGQTLLKDVAARLENAFRNAGYKQTGYYGVKGGFALVSQLEQIKPDGRPAAAAYRWSLQIETPEFFSTDYIRTLIKGKTGRYRLIVFAITTDEFFTQQNGKKVDSGEAYTLAIRGGSALPQALANQPVTNNHTCWALIYEFEKTRFDKPAEFIETSNIAADTHLQRIIPYLRR